MASRGATPLPPEAAPSEVDPEVQAKQAAAATKIQATTRGHQGRVGARAFAEEKRRDTERVPNSGWGFDVLGSVMLNSALVTPSPKIAVYGDLVPVEPIVAETVVATYEGARNEEGQYHGQGKATFHNGHKYNGAWVHGLMDGKGSFTWSTGISYTGMMQRGRIRGRGTLRWKGGNVYDGDVLDGFRHGKGKFVMVMESDEVEDESAVIAYDGMWHMGKRHGLGTLLYDSDGKAKYHGAWRNDERHGEGTMQYASGNLYTGHWALGAPHGQGQMLWHSRNEVYMGEWVEGKPHGKGDQVWFAEIQSGTPFQTLNRFSGEFAGGLRSGQGVFEYADGSVYTGAWKANSKHGVGTYVFPDGHSYAGLFENDRMVDYKKARALGGPPGAAGAQEVVLRVGDLLTEERDPEALLLKVKNVVVQYMSELKNIFRYYSQAAKEEEMVGKKQHATNPNEKVARPGGATSLIKLSAAQRGMIDNNFAMSMVDFWKMCKDCRIPDTRMTLAEIDRIFLLVDRHAQERTDILAVHNPHHKLIFRSFLEGLVRLADFKYAEHPSLAERLSHMLFHNILPYACQDSADDFKQRLDALDSRHFLQHYESFLQALYKEHSEEGEGMRVRGLVGLLKSRGIVNDKLSVGEVVDLHYRSSHISGAIADNNATNLDTEVIPTEFIETLARVAERRAVVAGEKSPSLPKVLGLFLLELLPEVEKPGPFNRAKAQKKFAAGAIPHFPDPAEIKIDRVSGSIGRNPGSEIIGRNPSGEVAR